MANANIITYILRLVTPEEIGEITTKHNGGKFFPLTELANERLVEGIHRDFSVPLDIADSQMAKILPFTKGGVEVIEDQNIDENTETSSPIIDEAHIKDSLSKMAIEMASKKKNKTADEEVLIHKEGETLSTFILIEKARLRKSQKSLKQLEILELYNKTSSVDVEQLKAFDDGSGQSLEVGILVNKKHY
jgi:hypothetical protein